MTDSTTYSGYEVAGLANQELTKKGLKPIPTQMVYNYKRNGLIRGWIDIDGQARLPEKEAGAWVRKYVGRRVRSSK